MNKTFTIITGLILSAGIASSQMDKSHFHAVTLNFLQIKEELNYGMVFRGLGLGYAYSAQWQNDKNLLGYDARFSFTILDTRDILAPSINVVPVRLDYLFKMGTNNRFCIGPFFTMEYNFEMYPDLQSGYSFWFTHYSLGGALNYSFNAQKHHFDFIFHTTLLGITSRNPVYDDPYFFDLSLGYVLRFVHQNFQFGTLNRYNQSELEIRWQPKAISRLAFAYTFQYYGYFNEPNLNMLNQFVKLIILPK
jgi:hypothetical protein